MGDTLKWACPKILSCPMQNIPRCKLSDWRYNAAVFFFSHVFGWGYKEIKGGAL